jgi:hypothetical protein
MDHGDDPDRLSIPDLRAINITHLSSNETSRWKCSTIYPLESLSYLWRRLNRSVIAMKRLKSFFLR